MTHPPRSLALLTDLYQLTMAYGYWKLGRAEQTAVFHLFFRKHPFGGAYALAAGLDPAADLMEALSFEAEDIAYLASLKGNDDQPLFERGFLDYLAELEFSCDVDAVPEGSTCFAHEPLLRITGPLLQCQLLETPLLNIINFQTLIATKTARIVDAADGRAVLEFGLRRAQGIDGGLAASRAAYIGGAVGTSNVLAGQLYGIPVKGTHAHSWVMSFDTELEAFQAYGDAMPNNCLLLVDTYDTMQGVERAIEVGSALRTQGQDLMGVRLDSGDLRTLSMDTRRRLDAGGFSKASIVASNDLDEYRIARLLGDGAAIDVFGVGTRLATAYDQPALGGVYKLAALKESDGSWTYRMKLSNDLIKVSNPGPQQVRRYVVDGRPVQDVIYDPEDGTPGPASTLEAEPRRMATYDDADYHDLLVPVFREGERVLEACPVDAIRQASLSSLAALAPEHRKLRGADPYPVGLDERLAARKAKLLSELRG